MVLALVAWPVPDTQWYRAGSVGWGLPWTLFSAACTHLSHAHLWANLLALAALALLGAALKATKVSALALLLAWPLTTLGLLAWPSVSSYAGLSGLIHAGLGILVLHCAFYSVAKPWGFVLLCGLVLKLLAEAAWLHPVVFSQPWGFHVVYAAHLTGVVVGAGLSLCLFNLRNLIKYIKILK